jgi:hypothetical protein
MARKTDTVTLADGRCVPIRQLSWLQIRSSQLARHIAEQAKHGQMVEALGGGEAFAKAYRALRKTDPEDVDVQKPLPASILVESRPPVVVDEDPLDSHDLLMVLVCGIPSWTKEQILNDLDDPDPELLARAILNLSQKPRTEEQEKNEPSSSTVV